MDPVTNRAIAGYAQAAAPVAKRPAAEPEAQGSHDFASFFRSLAQTSMSTLAEGEQASLQGLEGRLDAQSVVEAVAAAELTLQTVAAVRDRVIEAYQELIRMPI